MMAEKIAPFKRTFPASQPNPSFNFIYEMNYAKRKTPSQACQDIFYKKVKNSQKIRLISFYSLSDSHQHLQKTAQDSIPVLRVREPRTRCRQEVEQASRRAGEQLSRRLVN
jgi:hypothetical protein